jgi:hypothetical protein
MNKITALVACIFYIFSTLFTSFAIFISVLFVLSFEMNGNDYSTSELSRNGSESMDISDLSDSKDCEAEDVNLQSARKFCKVNTNNPSPAPPRFPFFTTPGIHMSVDTRGGILESLEHFFDDHFLNIILMETKHYAEQCIQGIILPRLSRHKYRCVKDVSEIYAFLALMIMQGIVRKPILK